MNRILIDSATIQRRVRELGGSVSRDFAGQELQAVVILKGATIFAADLLRSISVPICVEFMEVSSYCGTESTTEVTVVKDLRAPVEGRNLLLIEDIVDTGLTLSFLIKRLKALGPKSLRVCALLSKPARRQALVDIDYLGFTIADEFVVGYGLDYAEHFRNLPDLCIWQGNC
ncbi:MAG: hypoxanthine phosphoribosyltransferase [Dehalococcoidia bacterium]|nr:hypoxanthine phosphoribosyltransferase [Dehalococcoidia bacterium]